MQKHLRRSAFVAVVFAAVVAFVAPSAAVATPPAPLPSDSRLGRWWLGGSYTGTGVMPLKNSSGQKIGEYTLEAEYYGAYSVTATICVRDTLANGRGVIARLMVKYDENSSKEIGKGKFKGGSSGFVCSGEVYADTSLPIWAVDVDHGEDWSNTPYQYTGHFDRYVAYSNPSQRWPGFAP